MSERVFIGLGGNQGDSAAILRSAVQAIAGLPRSRLCAVSGVYRTPAWGGVEQPDYLNAVLELDSALPPGILLHELLAIERRHGRDRAQETRWGPRTLDCDILLYGERRIEAEGLQVPHPRMAQRAFVLVPLAELAPGLTVPGQGALMELLAALPKQPIERLAEGIDHVRQ